MARKGRDPDQLLRLFLIGAVALFVCWGIIYFLVTSGK